MERGAKHGFLIWGGNRDSERREEYLMMMRG